MDSLQDRLWWSEVWLIAPEVMQKHSRQLFFEDVIIEGQHILKNVHAVEQNQFPQNKCDHNESKANRTFRIRMLDLVAPDRDAQGRGFQTVLVWDRL